MRTCIKHPNKKAFSICHSCGKDYCEECLSEGKEYYYCKNQECQEMLKSELYPEGLPINATCPNCGSEQHHNFKFCANCGYNLMIEKQLEIKQKVQQTKNYTSIGCFTILGIILVIYIIGSISNKTSTSPIEKQFSSWDGSHIELTKLIKKSMNDPNSYEHEETVYWDNSDHLVVKTTFRGKNAFGGVVKNWIMAKVDLNGNVIEIISQGP